MPAKAVITTHNGLLFQNVGVKMLLEGPQAFVVSIHVIIGYIIVNLTVITQLLIFTEIKSHSETKRMKIS